MNSIVNNPWFLGFLSSVEAEELLFQQKVGTYLVRFSKSSPGAFGLDYVRDPGQISHVLIRTTESGFETTNHEKTLGANFRTFQDLLECFSHRLKEPVRYNFLKLPYVSI